MNKTKKAPMHKKEATVGDLWGGVPLIEGRSGSAAGVGRLPGINTGPADP